MKCNLKGIGIILAAALTLAGCQSMQKDLQITSADEKVYGELREIEETVVTLDGKGANREGLAKARQQIAAMEGTVADSSFQGLLAAWSGRLYLMEGKISDAQREYRKSQNLSPENLPSQILSFRLERDSSKRLFMIDKTIETDGSSGSHSLSGELLAERGRVLFDLNRFTESVAAFDSAFIVLAEKPFYEEAYRVFRDKAWELKDLGQGTINRTREIASQGEINWRDLIEVTKNETDYLRFITAGRDWPVETLFTYLVDRAFIPFTQDVDRNEWPSSKPSSSETVLRSGAAWFLWHLHAENRANRGFLTRYSSQYAKTPNAQSPVNDLSLSSPFLDSILGCIESEFMSLPDGRNFMPREKLKGSDYLSMLKKLN